jgi:hypothetical protein
LNKRRKDVDAGSNMLVIAIVISIAFALLCHLTIKNFLVALLVSILLSCLTFWKFGESHFGWLDRIFVENLLITAGIASLTSILIGKLIHKIRLKQQGL